MSPTPKKVKVTLSAGKVMASVFWDAQGLLLVDYRQKGYAVNGQYYSDLLRRLRENIKKKRPKFEKDCISRRVHRFKITQPILTIVVSFSSAEDVLSKEVKKKIWHFWPARY